MKNSDTGIELIRGAKAPHIDIWLWAYSCIGLAGLAILLLAIGDIFFLSATGTLILSILLISIGVIGFAVKLYAFQQPGIRNNGNWFGSMTNRGKIAWISAFLITLFYVVLYWFPGYLGLNESGQNTGIVGLFDPLSYFIKGQKASQWFVYGTLYTLAILLFGFKFILKYRHNAYQVIRTISVMFFQFCFAFMLPEILMRLNQPYYDFKHMWPLNYYFFFDWNIDSLLNSGQLGIFMFVWGIVLILIISPILTYYFGKRWYCSWVCGCGGLAETAGDPFRHLSDKSIRAWNIERWMIHGVLIIAIGMTGLTLYSYFTGQANIWFLNTFAIQQLYGFLIGAAFSGVIGVGFYPLLGSRVWCRFGCPLAAILGIQQKYFSRFRITTNGAQCISCGNCSSYCEMGIDVRHYAQRGQNIVRASCVGCGVCSAVCPRGVLRLENGSVDIQSRTTDLKTLHISEQGIRLEH